MKLWILLLFVCANIYSNLGADFTPEEKNLLEWEGPEEVIKTFPYYLSGYDEDGAPIWIWPFGRWDFRKLVEKGEEKNVDKYMNQLLLRWVESARNNTVPGGEEKTGFISIMDLEAYPLTQITHPATLRLVLKLIGDFSKSIKTSDLKIGYIINANFVFERLWVFAKAILGDLLGTIEIYGNNPTTWKTQFLKRGIPRDQLPEAYGGTKDHKYVKVYA